nr:MAG TPA: hypothetical protein [Caudoviricetes sp.]
MREVNASLFLCRKEDIWKYVQDPSGLIFIRNFTTIRKK